MRNIIGENLIEAMAYRKRSNVPNAKRIIVFVFIFTLIYILFAILAHPEDTTADFHFYSERGLITALSAIFLSMAGSFSLGTLLVHIREKVSSIWPWAVMALGFSFLALDETAQFHEQLGDIMEERSSAGVFRSWNDVIVILYGLIALPIVAVLLPSIARYRMTIELFALAFIFYVIHTLIDSTQESLTEVSIIL